MTTIKREIVIRICRWCDYEWQPRVPDPKSCPACKHRNP